MRRFPRRCLLELENKLERRQSRAFFSGANDVARVRAIEKYARVLFRVATHRRLRRLQGKAGTRRHGFPSIHLHMLWDAECTRKMVLYARADLIYNASPPPRDRDRTWKSVRDEKYLGIPTNTRANNAREGDSLFHRAVACVFGLSRERIQDEVCEGVLLYNIHFSRFVTSLCWT